MENITKLVGPLIIHKKMIWKDNCIPSIVYRRLLVDLFRKIHTEVWLPIIYYGKP